MAFGQLRLHTGNEDNIEPLIWKDELPEQVKTLLNKVIMPYFDDRIVKENEKEVVEKVLECMRDLLDEMGPHSLKDQSEMITTNLEKLLDKETIC